MRAIRQLESQGFRKATYSLLAGIAHCPVVTAACNLAASSATAARHLVIPTRERSEAGGICS